LAASRSKKVPTHSVPSDVVRKRSSENIIAPQRAIFVTEQGPENYGSE
jgi:hypothetical protein